jgi:hypothetical protein
MLLGAGTQIYRRSRGKPFYPPEMIFEGGGIRRGLSAVETGALIGLPRESVVLLAVTELLRKGFLVPEGEKAEHRFRVHSDLMISREILNPDARRDARSMAAMGLGSEVAGHEDPILELLGEVGGWGNLMADSRHWFAQLESIVVNKMAGFDQQPTREYYSAYCQHRLTGVEKGIFRAEDYLTWMVWWSITRTGEKDFSGLLEKTKPDWQDGSMSDWIRTGSNQASGLLALQ